MQWTKCRHENKNGQNVGKGSKVSGGEHAEALRPVLDAVEEDTAATVEHGEHDEGDADGHPLVVGVLQSRLCAVAFVQLRQFRVDRVPQEVGPVDAVRVVGVELALKTEFPK